jgi:hypothetical protein
MYITIPVKKTYTERKNPFYIGHKFEFKVRPRVKLKPFHHEKKMNF